MNKLIAFLAALLLATPLAAKGVQNPGKATAAAPTVAKIMGSPLQVNVGSDNSYQVFNDVVPGFGQYYPQGNTETADAGWFVRIGNTTYAPNFGEHPGGSATGSLGSTTAYTEVSISPVTGDGSNATPYSVSVVVSLGATGLRAVKTVTYVNGKNYYVERFRLVNTTGEQLTASIFFGSDLYLGGSDSGAPYREPTSGSPGGRTCPNISPVYTILHIPLTPATRFTATTWPAIWSQIGGGGLDNTVGTFTCADNGAGLQWNVTLNPVSSRTVLAATSFGDVPDITQFNVVEVVPGQGVIGTTLDVNITGFGFLPTTSFNFGAGITLSNLSIVNSTSATATLEIAPDAAIGYRDVVATQSPGGIVATLVEGFVVTEPPVWNYGLEPTANVHPQVFSCIRLRFPGNPTQNAEGWAPDEGQWLSEPPPGTIGAGPPIGLARAILDCYLTPLVWDDSMGQLVSRYCWLNPYPQYEGDYPHNRYARLKIYDAVNHVCEGQQPGWPLYESEVRMTRILFFPIPMGRSGFEDL